MVDLFSIYSSVGCIVRESATVAGRHAITNQEQASASMRIVLCRVRRQGRTLSLCVLALVFGLSGSAVSSAEQAETTSTVREINDDLRDAPKQCTWRA
jgi:hypothetical protein